jgi:ABC-2 type transport system permease protein
VKLRPLVIARKELLQLRRDRLTLGMMGAQPVLMLLLFGYAINTDVRHIPTLVYDQDDTAESRDLARRMEATGFYDVVGRADGYEAIDRALRSGTARTALVVPPRYGARLARGEVARVQLVVDGSDPQVVASAQDTAASLVAARSQQVLVERLERSGARPAPAPMEMLAAVRYNPEGRTAVYIVPGLIGVILTMTMVMLTAMAMARERERGTLEQLIVSPVRRVELVVGKILPYVVIGYVQMALILLCARLVFDVPITGSLGLLFALASAFIAASLAVGLFFSTLAKTQQQAMQMSFFFLLPNILLSGFMFPFEAMPRPAQWIAQMLPLTHFLRIVRGIVLKGSGFDEVRVEVLWLTAILVALVAFSSLRFRKKLV